MNFDKFRDTVPLNIEERPGQKGKRKSSVPPGQTEARKAEKNFLDTEIDKPIREELDAFDPSDLEIWHKIGDYLRRGNSEYFAEIRMLQCYMAPSHTNTHTVRGRPTAK